MTEYHRAHIPGATWFFTVNLAQRSGNRLLVEKVDLLRQAFEHVKESWPFRVEAVVILPDHLHCIWTLPPGDTDYSTRWNLIKGHFSRSLEKGERISRSREKRRERGCGNADFGSTFCGIRPISTITSTTSTGIRLNMAGQSGWPIGHTQVFIALWLRGFTPKTGAAMGNSIFLVVNDANDALRASAHPTGWCAW